MPMITIREHVPLGPLTSFKIGGTARHYIEAGSEEDIRAALLWAREHSEPTVILGSGSNVLIPDDGLEALVIRITTHDRNISNNVLTADAGCSLMALIKQCAAMKLGGWEKLAGIPGTIGGAIRGNAGAFGSEIQDFVLWVRALNSNTLETHEFSRDECEFSYRRSFFKDHPEWVILNVHLSLQKTKGTESTKLIEETIAERIKRHIQDVKAAGSYFMNPIVPEGVREQFEKEKGVESREGRVPAGWLIEKVGMKGASVGGAQASEQHPNYLINANHATSTQVRDLAKKIKKKVRDEFGVDLKEEAVVF